MLSFTIRKQLSPCNSSPWQDAYIFLTLNPSSFHLSWLDVFLLSCLHHKCTAGKFERLTFTFFVSDWFETWVTTCKILRLLIWRVFILWSLTLKMVQKHVNCSRLESPYCFNLIYSPLKKKLTIGKSILVPALLEIGGKITWALNDMSPTPNNSITLNQEADRQRAQKSNNDPAGQWI